jgi:hypothetical protein
MSAEMLEYLSPAATDGRYKAQVTRYRFITCTTLLFSKWIAADEVGFPVGCGGSPGNPRHS